MANKVPTRHRHEPPATDVDSSAVYVEEVICPNDDRITALEQQLSNRLAALSHEIREYVDDQQNRNQSTDVVQLQAVPAEMDTRVEFLIKRLESYESRLTTIEARVEDVEDRPHLSNESVRELMDGINTRFHAKVQELVAASNGDLRSQIAVLKSTAVAPQQTPAAEQLEKLAALVKSTGEYVESFERNVESHNADIEEKYAAIASHLEQTNTDVTKVKTMVYRLAAAVREDA